MRRLSPHLAPAGYSPARYVPLSPAPELDQGQCLTDIQAIQRLFAKGENGGYWPADPQYLFEDSAGTIPASVNGVVGLRVNAVAGKPNASQATTANKPYLRRTPVSGKYWLDSNTATGELTATFASALGSACTIARVGAEGVTILGNQTITTTYNIAPAVSYNGDILIINRALTVVEKALVTRVFGRNVPTLGSELVTNGGFGNGTTGWKSANVFTQNDAYMSIVNDAMRVTNTEVTATDLRFRATTLLTYTGAVLVSVIIKSGGATGAIRLGINSADISFATGYLVESLSAGFSGKKAYAIISPTLSLIVRSEIIYPANDYFEISNISYKAIL